MPLRLLPLLLLFFIATTTAQSIDSKLISDYFRLLTEEDRFMGALHIQQDSTVLYQNAFGLRDRDSNSPNTITTVFRLGSISKVFTATMIYQCIEEGKLTEATTLAEYFPRIPNADRITIGMMLRHKSGLFDYTADARYSNYMFTETSKNSLLANIEMGTAAFEPDTKTAYCNTNFLLLSFIIEQLDQTSYAQSLHNRIAQPLALPSIAFGEDAESSKNEALSYVYNGNFWQFAGETHMSVPMGAGAVVGNAIDLNSFMHALFENDSILSPETRAKMLATNSQRFGAGIFKLPTQALAYGHGGAIDGFKTRTAYLPEQNIAISLLSNGVYYDIDKIANDLLAIINHQPITLPLFADITLTDTQLDQYPGQYGSEDIGLEITITTTQDGKLSIQATGQQAFILDTQSPTEFSMQALDLNIIFSSLIGSQYQSFTLNQSGGSYRFDRISE